MPVKNLGTMQMGKQGLTENFFRTLKERFTTHRNVRISVLRSAGREKERIREFSSRILEELGKNYTSKIVGFTIFLKKWRKNVR